MLIGLKSGYAGIIRRKYMASRKIEDLHPKLQPLALAFKRACRDRGVDVLIYMTYRSCQEQNDLYQQGRTQKIIE